MVVVMFIHLCLFTVMVILVFNLFDVSIKDESSTDFFQVGDRWMQWWEQNLSNEMDH